VATTDPSPAAPAAAPAAGRTTGPTAEPNAGSVPAGWHPPRRVLELAELILAGFCPQDAGLPVGLPAPPEVAEAALRGGALVLEDAEGIPVAALHEVRPAGGGGLDGRLEPVRPFAHGPLRAARRTPAQLRRELAPGPRLVVAVEGSLDAGWPERVAEAAQRAGAVQVLVLALVGDGRRRDLPAAGVLAAARAAAAELPVPAITVPVAVPRWPGEAALSRRLVAVAAAALGADDLLPDAGDAGDAGDADAADARPRHAASAAELARAVPPPHRRGVTVFFTGLSGSGKSTVARGLAEALAAHRTVSLLDGDEVRRLLSAGLGFSRADRDLNIRRIGFVAAEITRHGGMAICAPIAPFAQARDEVRAWVEEVGDFVLVHVATPLAECERRDRKGLYAKARQGLIPDFTGISSPYEIPENADLRLDASQMPVGEAVEAVRSLLERRGYLADPAAGD
jgi:sulfate adenylyltransferase